jgi:hypothetical protein
MKIHPNQTPIRCGSLNNDVYGSIIYKSQIRVLFQGSTDWKIGVSELCVKLELLLNPLNVFLSKTVKTVSG